MPPVASPLFDGGRTACEWSTIALTGADTAADTARTQRTHLRSAGAVGRMEPHGPRLLHELQRDLPTLSPKLRSVARFCLQHASTLHHHRIKDVAEACGTIPASVVRLAQRFGLTGFQELKLAFLEGTGRETVAMSRPQDQWLHPECRAALQDIENSALGLASLKELVVRPEFLHAAHSLRSALHICFDWAGEEDRTIARFLQAGMRAAGCQRGDAKHPDALCDGAWLVQVAVWNDVTAGSSGPVTAGFGPRVLRLARGRMDRCATRTDDGVVIRVGTDARRMLNALALCEALAAAVKPGPVAATEHRFPSYSCARTMQDEPDSTAQSPQRNSHVPMDHYS